MHNLSFLSFLLILLNINFAFGSSLNFLPHTQEILVDSQKINNFKELYNYPDVETQEKMPNKTFGHYNNFEGKVDILQYKISSAQNLVNLFTDGVCDCIAVSCWDPSSKVTILYHVSKMELRENTETIFKKKLIEALKVKGKLEDFSKLNINLISNFWTKDLCDVIETLRSEDLPIKGIRAPDSSVVYDPVKNKTSIYFTTEEQKELFHKRGNSSYRVAIDSENGNLFAERIFQN
ncbi:MAG: hypothetical protein ACRYGR_09510 [Janthinobacterium lividum]